MVLVLEVVILLNKMRCKIGVRNLFIGIVLLIALALALTNVLIVIKSSSTQSDRFLDQTYKMIQIEKENAELREKNQNLEVQLELFKNATDTSRKTNFLLGDDLKLHPDNSVCRSLPLSMPSAETIWMENIGSIFEKSRHPRDHPEWDFKNFMSALLNTLPPSLLRKSVKTLPSPDSMRKVIDIVQRRKEFFERGGDKDDPRAPQKLKVLVMGGSVTQGVWCINNPENLKAGRYGRVSCAVSLISRYNVNFHHIL